MTWVVRHRIGVSLALLLLISLIPATAGAQDVSDVTPIAVEPIVEPIAVGVPGPETPAPAHIGAAFARVSTSIDIGSELAGLATAPYEVGSVEERIESLARLAVFRDQHVHPTAERLWIEQVNVVAAQTMRMAESGEVDRAEENAGRLAALQPGWHVTDEILARSLTVRIEDAIWDGDLDYAARAAGTLLMDFGYSDDNLRTFERARYARYLRATRNGDGPLTTEDAITAWDDMTALLNIDEDHPVREDVELLVQGYFDAARRAGDVESMELMVDRVEMYAVSTGTPEARRLAGHANYLAATRLWQEGGVFMARGAVLRARYYLEQAAEFGVRDDPLGTQRKLRRAQWVPALFPVGVLLMLGIIGFYHSGLRRRRLARKFLQRAQREERRGDRVEALLAFYRTVELTEELALLDRRDQLVRSTACDRLLRDALSRGRLREAYRWADKLADMPFELWPDDFDEMAGACGIDSRSRALSWCEVA